MRISFPGESPEYRAARARLLKREIELRREMEGVAVARRELPPGGPVPEEYVFHGPGPHGAVDVRLSELFVAGKDSLVIYNFMFPRGYGGPRPGPTDGDTALLPLQEGPCPSCVALLDQLDGAAEHVGERLNLVVVAKTSLPRLLTFAKERGWRHLRLLSSASNSYNRDYFGEDAEGWQMPMLNVFHRDGETIRHFWGAELTYAPADPRQDHRSVGPLEPLWNLFDLTREGRPMDWDERLSYQSNRVEAEAGKSPALASSNVASRIPVRDLGRARSFYTEKLGLEPIEERPGGLRYQCGDGEFALFESAGAATGSPSVHTQMAWEVDDLDRAIAELQARGVTFEEYHLPRLNTINAIAEVQGNYPSKGGAGERAAWFRDSEGNLLAIGQAVTTHSG